MGIGCSGSPPKCHPPSNPSAFRSWPAFRLRRVRRATAGTRRQHTTLAHTVPAPPAGPSQETSGSGQHGFSTKKPPFLWAQRQKRRARQAVMRWSGLPIPAVPMRAALIPLSLRLSWLCLTRRHCCRKEVHMKDSPGLISEESLFRHDLTWPWKRVNGTCSKLIQRYSGSSLLLAAWGEFALLAL